MRQMVVPVAAREKSFEGVPSSTRNCFAANFFDSFDLVLNEFFFDDALSLGTASDSEAASPGATD